MGNSVELEVPKYFKESLNIGLLLKQRKRYLYKVLVGISPWPFGLDVG